MTTNLPEDVISYILSYGDPDISVKYSYCLNQIVYNKNEFDVLCSRPGNTYDGWVDANFMYFILERNYQKKNNNIFYKTRPISYVAYRTLIRNRIPSRRQQYHTDAFNALPISMIELMEAEVMRYIND